MKRSHWMKRMKRNEMKKMEGNEWKEREGKEWQKKKWTKWIKRMRRTKRPQWMKWLNLKKWMKKWMRWMGSKMKWTINERNEMKYNKWIKEGNERNAWQIKWNEKKRTKWNKMK